MTNELSMERAIEALYTVRAYYASLTAGYPKGKDRRGIGDVMCSEIANSCLMAIQALEQESNRCDSCVHSEEQDGSNCYECIKGMADNFEAQPTDADCISREATKEMLIEEWTKHIPMELDINLSFVLGKINELPSVTPQPKMGKWTNGDNICPCCGEDKFKDLDADVWADWQPKYCPNCGAKMESGNNND